MSNSKKFIWAVVLLFSMILCQTAAADTPVGGDIHTDTTWTQANSPYVATSTINVDSGATLTIEPGVTVKFDNSTGLNVGFGGSPGRLLAEGTEADSIVFTSSSGNPFDWYGLGFGDSSMALGACRLDYCVVEKAGSIQPGIYCMNNGAGLEISHCRITGSGSYDVIQLDQSSPVIFKSKISGNGNSRWIGSMDLNNVNPHIDSCQFSGIVSERAIMVNRYFEISGNEFLDGEAAIKVYSGILDSSRTWRKQAGGYYWLIPGEPLSVSGGATLAIEPGVTLKFEINTWLRVGCEGQGRLLAQGTETDSITFTTASGNPDDWYGIVFGDLSGALGACRLDYCVVEKAGLGNAAVSCIGIGSALELVNSSVRNNAFHGVFASLASPTIAKTKIKNNAGYGILNYPGSSPLIGGSTANACELHGNGTYDIYNAAPESINARYNDWGTTDTVVINGRIYDYYDDWNSGIVYYQDTTDRKPPVISYAPLGFDTSLTSRAFTGVSVTDTSGVDTASGTRPRCYYKKKPNANAWGGTNDNTTNGWKWVEASGAGGSPFDFTIDYSKVFGGTATFDTIQYFAAAQDLADTPNVGINAGLFAAAPASVALTSGAFPIGDTIRQYVLTVTISGTKYVGAGRDFNTLTAAFTALNTRIVDGPVILLLTDSAYDTSTGESFPLTLSSVRGVGAGNTITIKPDAGASPVISGSASGSGVINVFGTGHVTIDGSNAPGGTSRDLTVANLSTDQPKVIFFGSLDTTTMTDVVLKNCVLDNGSISGNLAIGVLITGKSESGWGEGKFNRVTIENDSISKSYCGVFAYGSNYGPFTGRNLKLLNNRLCSTAPNNIGEEGLYIQGVDSTLIQGNIIANLDSSGAGHDYGILLTGVPQGGRVSRITRNKIFHLKYGGTGGWGSCGIWIETQTNTADVMVDNNLIYDISGDGNAEWFRNPIGIMCSGTQSGIRLCHNTINLYGNTLNQAGAMSMGIFVGTGSTAELRGNIVSNTLGLLAGAGYGACGVWAQSSSDQITGSDYNDYYVNAAGGGVNAVGKIGTTTTALTIAEWQAATGQDAHSIGADPLFVNPSGDPATVDVHCRAGSGYDPVPPGSHAGTPVSGITTDYDGEVRDPATPDIGADEYVVNRTVTASGTFPASDGYDSIMVDGPGVTAGLAGNCTAYGRLTIADGTLSDGGNILTLLGQVTNDGVHSGAGKMLLAGTAAQTISGTGTFGNLEINNISGVTLSGDQAVTGALTLSSGIVATGMNTLTVDTVGSVSRGSGYVVGSLRRYVPGGGARGSIRLKFETGTPDAFSPDSVAFDTVATGGYLTCRAVFDNGGYPNASDSLSASKRYWHFTRDASLDFDTCRIALWYTDADFNANFTSAAEDTMKCGCRYDDGTKAYKWDFFPVTRDTANNTVTLSKVVPSRLGLISYGADFLFGSGYGMLAGTSWIGVEEDPRPAPDLPKVFTLSKPYPNPALGRALLRLSLPDARKVKLDIYNILGQRVARAVDRSFPAGVHQLAWDLRSDNGAAVAGGVYFYRLTAGDMTMTGRLTALR